MRFKLDENIPVALARMLGGLGRDVDTVSEEHLTGRPDWDVWACSQDAERLLITQDLDFSDIRRFPPGTHSGILLLRLGTPSCRELVDRVGSVFLNEPVEEWHGAFVVVTDRKLRVTRPMPALAGADVPSALRE